MSREKAIERLKTHLKETNDCIIVTTPLNVNGYVNYQYKIGNKKLHILGHRLAYEIEHNVILTKDNIICHKCDTPNCINPKHLFLGTHADNVKDKVSKNRQAKGSKNGRYIDGRSSDNIIKKIPHYNRKFTNEEILKIREMKKNNSLSQIVNSNIFKNLTLNNCKDICSNRTYKDVLSCSTDNN